MRRMSILVWLTAVAAPMLLEAAPVTIVAFGDSTTARRGKLRVYPQVLREELPAKGLPATVLNAGVGGHTTAMGRARFERDVLARKPDVAIIQFGLNDSAVDVRKGATRPRLSLAAYEANLRHFVQTLRARGARPILMTANPRRWTARMKQLYGKPPYNVAEVQGFNVLLTDYVAAVRKVAGDERVPLIDVFDVFETYGKAKGQAVDDLLLDGLHPNDKGHRIIADLLMAQILKMAKAPKPPAAGEPIVIEKEGVTRIQLLPPGKGNPRNSEGDFIQLKDGRILFVYTHFTGGGGDHSKAHLAGRFSSDGGRTWTTEDVVVVPNEGTWNIMSVSLLRLRSGAIAMFYLRKNAIDDCRPYMRTSTDEAKTWSEPTLCISPGGYYVLNNDRVVQLKSGRLVAPVSRHTEPGGKFDGHGVVSCFLSDDDGRTWRQSRSQLTGKTPKRHVVLQEPGVVELKDGRLMMFMRTTAGCQYLSFSNDGGDTWTPAAPSKLIGPCSPASIERIPKTGDLLVVWNDHSKIDATLRGKRTPFNVAVSRDEGKTWQNVKTLEDDPGGWYCYTAVEFVGGRVLLGHCAGQRATGGLNLTQITLFDVAWLYR